MRDFFDLQTEKFQRTKKHTVPNLGRSSSVLPGRRGGGGGGEGLHSMSIGHYRGTQGASRKPRVRLLPCRRTRRTVRPARVGRLATRLRCFEPPPPHPLAVHEYLGLGLAGEEGDSLVPCRGDLRFVAAALALCV